MRDTDQTLQVHAGFGDAREDKQQFSLCYLHPTCRLRNHSGAE